MDEAGITVVAGHHDFIKILNSTFSQTKKWSIGAERVFGVENVEYAVIYPVYGVSIRTLYDLPFKSYGKLKICASILHERTVAQWSILGSNRQLSRKKLFFTMFEEI